MNDTANFQEWSKLAYRALDDCYRVIATIEPADTDEGERLDELTNRVRDLVFQALSLNGLSSFNYHALRLLQPNNTGESE